MQYEPYFQGLSLFNNYGSLRFRAWGDSSWPALELLWVFAQQQSPCLHGSSPNLNENV